MDIILTKAAQESIKNQVTKEKAIRIYISGRGWGGPRFAMSLDEATDQDVKKEVGGIPFIIEKKLDYEYDGIKIDYKKTLFKSGFTIKLKEAISQCSN